MEAHPDQQYIKALVDGDDKKIDEIYSQLSSIVTSYVLNNSGTVDHAEDVFQEAIIDLFRKGQNGFILTCPFKPYFLAMCRYKWLDQIKGDKTRVTKELDSIMVTNLKKEGYSYIMEDVQDAFEKELTHSIYRKHFALLSQTCQDIIGMSLLVNETTNKPNTLKEIAAELGLNYSYVRREKNNCINKLIASIKKDADYSK